MADKIFNLTVIFGAINKITKPLEKLSNDFKGVILPITAVGVAAGKLFKDIMKEGGGMEEMRIQFDYLTGSMEKSREIMSQLEGFSIRNAFDEEVIKNAGKELLKFGYTTEQVVPEMENIGNIAAAVGKNQFPELIEALGRTKQIGHMSTRGLMSFTHAGVNLRDEIKKTYNITDKQFDHFMSKGKITYDVVRKAVEKLAKTKYAGAMAKQGNTLFGLFQKLRNIINNFMEDIGEALIPTVKNFIYELMKWIKANKELIKSSLIDFFKSFLNIMKSLMPTIQIVVGLVMKLVTWFGNLSTGKQQILIAILAIIVGFSKLKKTIEIIPDAINLIFRAMTFLQGHPIFAAIAGLAALYIMLDKLEKKQQSERRKESPKYIKEYQKKGYTIEEAKRIEEGRVTRGFASPLSRQKEVEYQEMRKKVLQKEREEDPLNIIKGLIDWMKGNKSESKVQIDINTAKGIEGTIKSKEDKGNASVKVNLGSTLPAGVTP